MRLRANIAYSLLTTLSGFLFPLVTFPYASRMLMPQGIGAVDFLDSVVMYIMLVTALGVPLYGVRKVAALRSDRTARDRAATELLALSGVLSLAGCIVVAVIALCVSRIHAQASLFIILSIPVLLSGIGAEWVYQAVEDFGYIALRTISIRALCAAALFVFVKGPDDLMAYGAIVSARTALPLAVNALSLRRHINFSAVSLSARGILQHLRPVMRIFMLTAMVSIYARLNTIMLGFMADDHAVGLFTAANKMSAMCIAMVAALGTALLPRMSALHGEGRRDEFRRNGRRALLLTIVASVPMAVALTLLARPLIALFCGTDFLLAAFALPYTAAAIPVIATGMLAGMQILYPQGREGIVIAATATGAVIDILLNIMLIPSLNYVGAAIASLITEIAVTAVILIAGRKYL